MLLDGDNWNFWFFFDGRYDGGGGGGVGCAGRWFAALVPGTEDFLTTTRNESHFLFFLEFFFNPKKK